MKQAFGLLVLVVGLVGCGETAITPGIVLDGGTDSTVIRDIGTDSRTDSGSTQCTPVRVPAPAAEGKCTQAFITCQAAARAQSDLEACISQHDPSRGCLICQTQFVANCATDPAIANSCGSAFGCFEDCVRTACANEMGSQAQFNACVSRVQGSTCATQANSYQTCLQGTVGNGGACASVLAREASPSGMCFAGAGDAGAGDSGAGDAGTDAN